MRHEPPQQVLAMREARPGRHHGARGLLDIVDVGVSWDDPQVAAALAAQRDAPGRLTTRVRIVNGLGPVHLVGTTVDLDAAAGPWAAWAQHHAHDGRGTWWAPALRVWWTTDVALAHDLLHALQHEACARWVMLEADA